MLYRKLSYIISIYKDERRFGTCFELTEKRPGSYLQDKEKRLFYDVQLRDDATRTTGIALAGDFIMFTMNSKNPVPDSRVEFASDYLTLFLMTEANLKSLVYSYMPKNKECFVEEVNKNIRDSIDFRVDYDEKMPDKGKTVVVLNLAAVNDYSHGVDIGTDVALKLDIVSCDYDETSGILDYKTLRDYITEIISALSKGFSLIKRNVLLD